MVKRIIEAYPSDFMAMTRKDLLQSIRISEGRTIMAEVVCTAPTLIDGVSNIELACAFGADMITLNVYDVNNPMIFGFPNKKEPPKELFGVFSKYDLGFNQTINDVKKFIGRPVGINLEPVDTSVELASREALPPGRIGNLENAEKAYKQGADFIVLTGNPRTGVTTRSIISATKEIKENLGDKIIIIAGKMHSAGILKDGLPDITTKEDIVKLYKSECNVILLPAPGTVPGVTLDMIKRLTQEAHKYDMLVESAFGTSQEGADLETIKRISLMNKMAGVDIHHIGDAGFSGVAIPENIIAMSIAVRGKRHTYRRIAASLLR